jgi:predicted permease
MARLACPGAPGWTIGGREATADDWHEAARAAHRIATIGRMDLLTLLWKNTAVAAESFLLPEITPMTVMPRLERFLRDLRHARRRLIAAPLLATTAVVALALGIGANTAIFSLFDRIVFRALPVAEPNRLVLLRSLAKDGPRTNFSEPAYAALQAAAGETADLFAHAGLGTIDVSIAGMPERTVRDVAMVSGNYFTALRVATVTGRPISTDDDAPTVAVISHRLWTSRFGADPAAIGRSLTLNGTPFTIIGVAPPSFFGTSVGEMVDIWIPLAAVPAVQNPLPGRPPLRTDVDAGWLTVMGRLKPGVTQEAARRDLDVAYSRFLRHTFGAPGAQRPDLVSQRLDIGEGSRGVSVMRDELGGALVVLMVLVGAVLLIACANVANLFVGRAVSRQREIVIRQALGAGRTDLLRQLLAESLIVAGSGGALGLIVARWSWSGLLAMMSPGRGFAPIDVGIDARALALTLLTSVVAALLCSFAPAWQADRRNVIAVLKADRLHDAWGGRGRAGIAAKALLITQVALSACLLVAAGELVRSFRNLTSVPTGFAASNQIVLRVDANRAGLPPESRRALFAQVRERLASLPGVRGVAMSDGGFFSGSQTRVEVSAIEGGSPQRRTEAVWMHVTPGYFATLGLDLSAGRDFSDADGTAAAPLVAIVNEALARRCLGDRPPLGSLIALGKNMRLLVIGVVRDARYRDLRKEAPPMLYAPMSTGTSAASGATAATNGANRRNAADATTAALIPASGMYTVRVDDPLTAESAAFGTTLARAVHDAASQLVVSDITPMTALIDRTLTIDRLVATLSAAFALLAILLAACGLYAVMSTAVARRTREIGIRAALGADPSRLARAVLGEALTTVCLGVAIGLGAALMATSLIAHIVFGLSARDPLTFAIAAIALLVIGALASYVPARRAATIDPLVAIRCD